MIKRHWDGALTNVQANMSMYIKSQYVTLIASYFRRVFILGYFEVAFFFENNFLGPSLHQK